MKQVLTITDFSGGMTVAGDKVGPKGSFIYGRSIDFRKKPNQFTILPATTQIGQGVIDDLIVDIVQVADGSRYALGSVGKFYKISTSNQITSLAGVGSLGNSAYGIVYRQDTDRIIITGTTTASSYFPISGSPVTPTLEPNKYAQSASTIAVVSGGTLTYTVPITTSESDADKITFQPDIEPLYSFSVKIIAPGTGDWTITMHDDANNVLGTKTVTNANLVATYLNEFVITTPVRMLVKPNARTYHFHVSSTVGDGTLATSKAGDCSMADYSYSASRFVTPNNGMHPAINFLQYTCFGNERYLSVWEPLETTPTNAEWQRHALTFQPGYEVCGLALYNEFLAIACEKRSTSGTQDYQEGRIFFWDGTSTTYNFSIDVPEGSPYGLYQYKNVLYWFAGNAWWAYTGGAPVKLKTFPNTDAEFSNTAAQTIIYPNMSTVRNGVLLMGFPSQTTSQSVEHGIYSWGAVDKNYANSFGYSYPMSTGSRTNNGSNNLRIGMVKNFGDSLYMSWRDDSNAPNTYGLDVVNNSSAPFATASYEALISDNGQAYKRKSIFDIFATFATLPAGATITLKYKIDRDTNWNILGTVSSGTFAKFSVVADDTAYYDIQIGIDIVATTTTPTIYSLGMLFDDNREETMILGVNSG